MIRSIARTEKALRIFALSIRVTKLKTTADEQEANPEFQISFAEMQRMHLRKLQIKLMEHAIHVRTIGEEPQDWGKDLAEYGELCKLSTVTLIDPA